MFPPSSTTVQRGTLPTSNLHPAFARALEGFAPPAEIPAIDQYRKALARHDWHYEFSDHGPAWDAGRKERQRLRNLQRELDPSGAIWNSLAPAEHHVRGVA